MTRRALVRQLAAALALGGWARPAVAPQTTGRGTWDLRTIDGQQIRPAIPAGKIGLVNFWATWCPPCIVETPDLVILQQKYREHLQMIGVSEDEGPLDAVQTFVRTLGVNYPVGLATPEIHRIFPGVETLPTTFLIDRSGRIVEKYVGQIDPGATERRIRELAGL